MQPQLKKTLWIVVPSILFLCVVLVFSVIYSYSDKGPGGNATPAAANVMRFADQDFAFVPPPDPWQQDNPAKFAQNATLCFVRMNPRMVFVVIPSRLPDPAMTLDTLGQQAIKDIQASFANANFQFTQNPGQKNVNGIPGIAVVHHADANGTQQTYVHWIGTQRGLVYHVMVFGLASDEGTVLSEAENMLGRFHPLSDFPAAPGGPSNALGEFTSSRYRYVIRFNDPNWHQWPDFVKTVDYAEVGVLNGGDTCLVTSALDLGNLAVDFDALLASFASVVRVNLTSENTARLRSNNAEGAVIVFPRENLQHIIELVRLKNALFIGHAWTGNPQKFPLIRDQLLNNINFPSDPPTAPVQMTPAEEKLCGKLLNELGITYVRANRPAQAIPILERAQQLLPNEAVIFDNKAVAQLQNAQPQDARLTINLGMQRFPNEPALKARAALINTELGDNTTAQGLYSSIFNNPEQHSDPRTDPMMVQYARFLMQQGSIDKAKEIVEKYRGGSDSSRGISVLYATILGKKGDHAAAIDILERLRKTTPATTAPTTAASTMPSTAPTTLASADTEVEPDLLIALGKEYNAAGKYSEALDLATDLIKRGVDTVDVYLIQAGALAGTKKFTDAKTAVEAALRRNSTLRECFDMQRSIADGLGQNDKALYTKAIDSVAIPQQVLEGIPKDLPPSPSSSVADALGAYTVARVGAVAYETGKDFRTTEFQRVKALTRQGGERVSSFDFRFNPSIETIYVNKAEVKNASGNVVSTAKAEDAFVIDAPSEDSSLQKKVLRISVTGLAPDCTLDLIVTRKPLTPPAHMKFTRYFMSSPMLVQRTAFVLRTPDLAQIHDSISMPSIDKKTYGDAVCWQLDNPPIYRGEPVQPEPSNFLPMVAIGDAKTTWEQVGEEYLAALKNVLVEDPECRTLAAKLISGKTTEQDKLDAIAAHVQKEIANKYNELATNDRVPRKPADVIRDKSGDAKDQALLFYQLLRAAGFENARLALVSRSDKIEPDKASIDQFDHIVVCLGSTNVGDTRFFDSTEKDLKIESPPDTIAGSKALVLQGGGSALIDVAAMPADASRIKVVREVNMDVNAVLTIHEKMELSGPAAALWRSPLKPLKPEEQKQQIQSVMARAQVPAEITKLDILSLDDPQKPLVVDITYTSTGAFQQQQNAVVGRLPATWERHWLIPPQLSRRETAFYIRVPMKIETEMTLHLPEKVKLANTLKDENVGDAKYGTLKSSYTVKPGELSGKLEIHTTAGRYDKDAYPGFFDSRKALIEGSQPPIALQAGQ